jgi:hypothetical protein
MKTNDKLLFLTKKEKRKKEAKIQRKGKKRGKSYVLSVY